MTAKEEAKRIIDDLPPDATLDSIIDALYLNIKIRRAEQDIQEGKSHV